MAFPDSGNLITDKRTIDDAQTWDTQTEWEAYQSKDGVIIENGILKLDGVPNSLVSRYTFEDDSNTSTASDVIGSNDMNLTGPTFDSDAGAGNFALSQDGINDFGVSQTTVNLSSLGSTAGASVGARIKPSEAGTFQFIAYWGGGSGSDTYLALGTTDTDEWRGMIFSAGGKFQAISGGSISTTAYKEVIVASDNTDIWLIEDGTEVARATITSGADLTSFGAVDLGLGRNADTDSQYFGGLSDNVSFHDEAITAANSDGAV